MNDPPSSTRRSLLQCEDARSKITIKSNYKQIHNHYGKSSHIKKWAGLVTHADVKGDLGDTFIGDMAAMTF